MSQSIETAGLSSWVRRTSAKRRPGWPFWLLVVSLFGAGCNSDERSDETLAFVRVAPKSEIAITTFCSSCHAMPNPTSFSKQRWHHEVKQGIDLYRKSQRTDLVIPDFEATLAWFQQYAPEEIEFEPATRSSHHETGIFDRIDIPVRIPGQGSRLTAVSHSSVLSETGQPPQLAMADMREGYLWLASLQEDAMQLSEIGRVANAAHIEPTDLDGDGVRDFVVADLGGFFPRRNRTGSLWWFHSPSSEDARGEAGSATEAWRRVPLQLGMMRVSDARPADFDADGDLDLVVAEFGLHFHGGIHLLTNVGNQDGVPRFESRLLDDRPGAIHVPVVDLNQDGRLDFVALISQHHEAVVAFLNQGDGTFRQETIYEAGDPAYGSSGIELVDFDGDGDVDVLMSNGDTFDDQLPKPMHSVAWLENEGKVPFRRHAIGMMPGAYRAVAGDVDGDGDMDVAAVALLFKSSIDLQPQGTFDGVVYFEQTQDGTFLRHSLQVDRCNAATCRLIDWEGDGDLDLVVFPFSTEDESAESITLFQNNR